MCPPYIPGSRTSTSLFMLMSMLTTKKTNKKNPHNLGGKNTRFEVTSHG